MGVYLPLLMSPAHFAAQVYEAWETASADALQEKLTRARLTIQAKVMIPALKGLLARHRNDKGWINLRPPHISMSQDEIRRLEKELKSHTFAIAA